MSEVNTRKEGGLHGNYQPCKMPRHCTTNFNSSKRGLPRIIFYFVICIFSILCTNVHGLNFLSKPDTKMSSKRIFLNELNEARSGNPILSNKDPNNLDILLNNMITDNPSKEPGSTSALLKYSKGKWRVVYAPHIKTLGNVLFSTFTVFYEFYDISDSDKQGIISNVFYDSKLFGKGWLNTQGKVDSVSSTVCRVKWDNIWWNLSDDVTTPPALLGERTKQVLPDLIQRIGTKGFVEEFSKFPVLFLDSDFCVFEFSAFGTKICAERKGLHPSDLEDEHARRRRDEGTACKKNSSNVAYDILNLQYSQDTGGEQQKYVDKFFGFFLWNIAHYQ